MGEVTAMEALLQGVGQFFTQSIEWLSTVLSTIVESPALLILCIAMPTISFSVGLLKRLMGM